MKSKNLILGLLAFVFAISAAFTTKTMGGAAGPVAWVIVKHSIEPEAPWFCVDIGQHCDEFGEFTCKVNVSTFYGPKIVTAKAPPEMGAYCVTLLKRQTQYDYLLWSAEDARD